MSLTSFSYEVPLKATRGVLKIFFFTTTLTTSTSDNSLTVDQN